MITKSFKLTNRNWHSLLDNVQLSADTIYCIQPNKSSLFFYQGDLKPTKDDFGIGVDPSGILKFKYSRGGNYYIRILDPENTVITITEAL